MNVLYTAKPMEERTPEEIYNLTRDRNALGMSMANLGVMIVLDYLAWTDERGSYLSLIAQNTEDKTEHYVTNGMPFISEFEYIADAFGAPVKIDIVEGTSKANRKYRIPATPRRV